jgi:hypothetical protein
MEKLVELMSAIVATGRFYGFSNEGCPLGVGATMLPLDADLARRFAQA